MTTQSIVTAVQKYLDDVEGADADTTSVLQAVRLATLELASLPIVKDRILPTTSSSITLVTDQTEYALPSNYNYNISEVVWDSTANLSSQLRLNPVTVSEVFTQQQDNGASIDGFAVRGNYLIFNGTPDSTQNGKTIKITYAGLPDITLIQNDATETTLGTKYPHVLIDMSIRRFLLLDIDNSGVYDRYKGLVDEHKETIRQELETVAAEGEFTNQFPPL